MAKNIVICSDGTGNTAIKGRGTNVFKLYEAVDFEGHRTDSTKVRQIGFYDDGVGTSRLTVLALLGGAFGLGLGRNVRKLYAEVARVYDPGDAIFLFGFSRGAFTVRTLSGLIAACGIVDRTRCESDDDLLQRVGEAYKAYRDRYRTRLVQIFRGPASDKPESVIRMRTQWAVQHEHGPLPSGVTPEPWQIPINFIGVWDTVDAVGFPVPGLAELWNTTVHRYKFPDHVLGPMVMRARHALAIDDERHTFHPLLWDEKPKDPTAKTDPERIKQVWFSGAHSNVGGGYPKQGMSVVSLAWMMDEAEAVDLRFSAGDRQLYHERQNIYDKLYDSRAGSAFFYRYMPRDIRRICQDHHAPSRIHVSVVERCLDAPEGYAPGNIPGASEIVGPEIPVVTETVLRMRTRLAAAPSMLGHVRGLVALRRATPFLAIAVGVLLTIMVLTRAKSAISGRSGWDAAGAVGTFAVMGLAAIVVTMTLACAVNWMLTRRMKGAFSRFWFAVRPAGDQTRPTHALGEAASVARNLRRPS